MGAEVASDRDADAAMISTSMNSAAAAPSPTPRGRRRSRAFSSDDGGVTQATVSRVDSGTNRSADRNCILSGTGRGGDTVRSRGLRVIRGGEEVKRLAKKVGALMRDRSPESSLEAFEVDESRLRLWVSLSLAGELVSLVFWVVFSR